MHLKISHNRIFYLVTIDYILLIILIFSLRMAIIGIVYLRHGHMLHKVAYMHLHEPKLIKYLGLISTSKILYKEKKEGEKNRILT